MGVIDGGQKKPRKPRATKPETRARRERISWLRSHGVVLADQILKDLRGTQERPGPFPKTTLKVVYNDVEYIQAHAGEYIATQFLPQLGEHFQNAVAMMETIAAEAWRRYQDGETEEHTILSPDGTTTKTIHREGGAEWLRLAGMAKMAILKLGQHGLGAKTAAEVMADYNRLKELERRGILVGPIQPRT